MGESSFRLLAKDGGLVANASSDDKAGWDFEVEVPSPLSVNYSSQSRPLYRVQVKATMGEASTVSLTFSSLLSLIQFGGPAFVFLACFGTDSFPEKAYLLHLDEKIALKILTSLRKKHVANPSFKLNKSKFALKFGEETRLNSVTGLELTRNFDAALNGSYLRYIEVKTKWLRKIEEDSTRWRVKIHIEDDKSIEAMAECFLGYEHPFNGSSIHYFAPLGIPDKELEKPEKFNSTTITPIEADLLKVIVRLGTSEYGSRYEFNAKVYTVPSNFPKRYAALRIQSNLFDMVYRSENSTMEFRFANLLEATLKSSAKELRSFIEFMAETLENHTTYIEVIPTDNTSPLKITLVRQSVTVPEDFYAVRERLNSTYLKLAALGLTDEILSPAYLLNRPATFEFLRHIGQTYEPAMSFEFNASEETRDGSDVTIFSAPLELEGKTVLFFAAFFGSVERIRTGILRGNYSRSEYLGEIIVPVGHDLNSAQKNYSDQLEKLLQNRGFVVT